MSSTHRFYPYFENNRFANYPGEKKESVWWPSLCIFLKSLFRKHDPAAVASLLDVQQHLPAEPLITWIGHATFLIKLSEMTILTDPVFGHISPLFKRLTPPAIALENLPRIDVILISHNHWDHMHAGSLKALLKRYPKVQVLVPQGDRDWFIKQGFKNVRECIWWEQFYGNQSRSIKFSFLPAYHWSQRGLFDRNRSLWGSWMIESSQGTIYFAGDTAYSKHFKAIGKEFPHIDIALMPIAPCEPHEWMKFSHVNAEEAGQGFLELGARHFIPMHWGTYYFGTDHPLAPLERLNTWWQRELTLPFDKQLHFMKMGQPFLLSQATTTQPMPVVTPQDYSLTERAE